MALIILAPTKQGSRTVDKVTREKIHHDILDSHELTIEQNRSAYRYFLYRFLLYTKMTKDEEASLKLLLKKDLRSKERTEVTLTLK